MRTLMILAAAMVAAPTVAQTASPAATAEPPAGPTQMTTGASAALPQLAPGAIVYDTAGDQVGTIESVAPDAVVVSTGTAKASIPPASFGQGASGPVLAMTRAQLEAAVKGTPSGG